VTGGDDETAVNVELPPLAGGDDRLASVLVVAGTWLELPVEPADAEPLDAPGEVELEATSAWAGEDALSALVDDMEFE
jgi:hypothetical protein